MSSSSSLSDNLTVAVESATEHRFRAGRIWQAQGDLLLEVLPAGKDDESVSLPTLIVRKAAPGVRAYREIGPLAMGYRGQLGNPSLLPLVEASLQAIAAVLIAASFDPERDALPIKSERDLPVFPTPYHKAWLDGEASVDPDVVRTFQRDGHVVLRRAIPPDILFAAMPYLLEALRAAWPAQLTPLDERPDAYSRSFVQLNDLGLSNPIVATLTQSRRLGLLAAKVMNVTGVRSFCDNWLVKESGAPITPWHQDEAVYPFDAEQSITLWIPLQNVEEGDGLLRMVTGSQHLGLGHVDNINEHSEQIFADLIVKHQLSVATMPSMCVGDISLHHGRTVHGAFPNFGPKPRIALVLHWFADGARVKQPTSPVMAKVLQTSAPGLHAGDEAVSRVWPLIYSAKVPVAPLSASVPCSVVHLRATLLPFGTEPQDIWIVGGRVSFDPVAGAQELSAPAGFLLPGLVDCHSHISYAEDRDNSVGSIEWMNGRRAEHTATGVTLLRDMGALDDQICKLVDVPGLARIQPCGRMILRTDTFAFTKTEPEQLVSACLERIKQGARWVKIFADWSDDFSGHQNSGFNGSDEVTYPLDILSQAVREVHAAGGRVAAHCFTRAGAEVSIVAGVDSLEHGWGLDESLVLMLAERNIAWVPLVGIAPHMWRVAHAAGETERCAWIVQTMSDLGRLLPLAEALGVRVLVGTDMFPSVTVADEIRQLCELGLSREAAVGGGSWVARAWLGETLLTQGAVADMVLFPQDPRKDLDVLLRPSLILVGGERRAPSFAHARPVFVTWSQLMQCVFHETKEMA